MRFTSLKSFIAPAPGRCLPADATSPLSRTRRLVCFFLPRGSPSDNSQTQCRFQCDAVHPADDEDVRQYSYQIHHSYKYQSSAEVVVGASENEPDHEGSH